MCLLDVHFEMEYIIFHLLGVNFRSNKSSLSKGVMKSAINDNSSRHIDNTKRLIVSDNVVTFTSQLTKFLLSRCRHKTQGWALYPKYKNLHIWTFSHHFITWGGHWTTGQTDRNLFLLFFRLPRP